MSSPLTEPPPAPGSAGGEPGDLVLIEDDVRLSELLCWFLERGGHRVRCARSFTEARILLAERAPDLLLSDVRVGEAMASEELPRIASEGLLPPTLVVSGYLDRALIEALESIPGVLGTLRKPFEMPTLEAAVAKALAS